MLEHILQLFTMENTFNISDGRMSDRGRVS